MKVVCVSDNLRKGVSAVSRIVGKNASLPILSHILLETDGGRLKLSATNLELGGVCWVGCRVEDEGRVAIPAHLLEGVVSNASADNITLELIDNTLRIRDGHSRSEVCTLNADDFPLIPRVEGDHVAMLDAAQLSESLSRVVNACAQSEARPEISGVYMSRREKSLVLAATDSYRLAEVSLPSSGKDFSFILPSNAAAELVRLASDISGEIELILSSNQAFFKFQSFYLVSRLIDGQYPDYTQIVPTKFSTSIELAGKDFARAVKAVALFADKKTNDIRLACIKDDPTLHVSAVSAEAGRGQMHLASHAFEGGGQDIIVNYRYLLDGLSNIDTEQVVVKMNNDTEPLMLQPKGSKEYYYILMPINT